MDRQICHNYGVCRLDALLAKIGDEAPTAASTPDMKVPSTLISSAQSAADPLPATVTPGTIDQAGQVDSHAEKDTSAVCSERPSVPESVPHSTRDTPTHAATALKGCGGSGGGGLARLLSRIRKGPAATASTDAPRATSKQPIGSVTRVMDADGSVDNPCSPMLGPSTPPLGRHAVAAARLQVSAGSPSTPQGDFPPCEEDTVGMAASFGRAAAPLPFMSPAGRWQHEGGLHGAEAQGLGQQQAPTAAASTALMPQTPPQPQRRGGAWMHRATAVSDSFPSGLPSCERAMQHREHSAARWSWDAATGGSRPPPLLQPAAHHINQTAHSGELTPVMGPVTAPLRFYGAGAAASLGVTPPGSSSNDTSPHAMSELAGILQATPGSLVPGMSDRSPADVARLAPQQHAPQQTPPAAVELELSGHSTLMPVPHEVQQRANNPHTRELLAALFSPGPRSLHRGRASGSRLPRPHPHSQVLHMQPCVRATRMPSPGVSPVPCMASNTASPQPPPAATPGATPSRLPVARRLFSPSPSARRVQNAAATGGSTAQSAPRHRLTPRQPSAAAQPQPASTSRAAQPVRTASYGKQALSIAVNLLRSPPVGSTGRRSSRLRSKSARRNSTRPGSATRALSTGRGPLTLEEWQATPGGIALVSGCRSAPTSAHKASAPPTAALSARRRGGVPTAPSSSSAILSSLMFR